MGANAAKIAAGFQADVAILDVNMDRLRYLDDIMPANVNVLFSDRYTIREELRLADLVIGVLDDASLTVSGYTPMKCMREYIGAPIYDIETKTFMIPMRYRVMLSK